MASSLLDKLKWGALALLAAFIFASYGIVSLWNVSITDAYLYLAPRIGAAIFVLIVGKAFIELTSPILARLVRRSDVRESAERILAWAVWCTAVFIAAAIFVGDLSAIIIAFGLVLLGVAFAFRKPLLSIVGWLSIIGRGTYSRGDVIKVGSIMGEVADISMLSTTIWDYRAGERGQTGTFISMPNSFIFEQPIAVLQRGRHYVWDEISVSMPPGPDCDKARAALLKACDEVIGAKKMGENAREQQEALEGFGLSSKIPGEPVVYTFLNGGSVELRLRYLVDSIYRDEIKSAISEHALQEMLKNGIGLRSREGDHLGKGKDRHKRA